MEIVLLLLVWPIPVCLAFTIPRRYLIWVIAFAAASGSAILAWSFSAEEASMVAVYMAMFYLMVCGGVLFGGFANLASLYLARFKAGNYVSGLLFVFSAVLNLWVVWSLFKSE